MFQGKTKSGTIQVVISNISIDSCISRDELVSVNNVLRENNEMKEEIKNSVNTLYKYGWYKQKNIRKKWRRNNSR